MSYNPTSPLVANVWNRLPAGGEFQGYNGDCTEYSFMVGACALAPSKACTKAELDRLTAEAINAGQAGQQGAMTAANLVWLCNQEHQSYAQGGGATFKQVLVSAGNVLPIIVQVNNGAALPGNEAGVKGHAVVVLAVDPTHTRMTIANGDSTWGKQGQLDYCSVQDMLNAQPFAVTTLGTLPHVATIADYQARLAQIAQLAAAPV
jgi:hypothetical protein